MIESLPERLWFKALSVALVVAALVMIIGFPWFRLDIAIYRVGGQAWLTGADLYGHLPAETDGMSFPFTYPPIAAILFSPLALIPLPVATIANNLISLALLFLIFWWLMMNLGHAGRRQAIWWAALLTGLSAFFGPIASSFGFGQINILLMFAVLLDAFVVPPRFRGWLTGAAVAVKLTPGVFVVYYLVKREWRSAVTAMVSTVVFTGIGFAAAWSDSREYWTSVLWNTGRIGNPAYVSNQSITGEVARLGITGHFGTAIWIGLVVCVLAGAALLTRRLIERGYPQLAIGAIALFGLLASPVSWEHHYVWVGPLIAALVLSAIGQSPKVRKVMLGLVVAGIVCFVLPPSLLPISHSTDGPPWAWYDNIIGNLYLIWAVAYLIAAWWLSSRLAPVTAKDAPGTRPDRKAEPVAA